MKISLGLGNPTGLSRQTAWGCLTTNLAIPGFGSIAGGRMVGFVQAALCLAGMALTMVFGVRFVVWALANWSRLHDPQADQVQVWGEMWHAIRWALFGMLAFAFSWIWALATSFSIVHAARKTEMERVPPRL